MRKGRALFVGLRLLFLGGIHRADAGTCAAGDAFVFIDDVFSVACFDAADRAFAFACTAGDAFIADSVRHGYIPPCKSLKMYGFCRHFDWGIPNVDILTHFSENAS